VKNMSATVNLSSKFDVGQNNLGLTSSFFINRATYFMEYIRDGLVVKGRTPTFLTTVNAYATLFEEDVEGLSAISVLINNSHGSNGITYTLAVRSRDPAVWHGVESHVDINVAAGLAKQVQLAGDYDKLRLQVKNQTTDQAAQAWGGFKGRFN
jgi:hypothetical protein